MRRIAVAVLGILVVGCASHRARPAPVASAPATSAHAVSTRPLARWMTFVHVRRPVDMAGPRADGSFVLAADGRLWTLTRTGRTAPLAPSYHVNAGDEPYIALAPPRTCFTAGAVYAIRLHHRRGVTEVDRGGRVRRFASIHAPGLINGITFGFGGRLLVTVGAGSHTAVLSIDCHGRVNTITRSAPRVEGGIAVAPAGFGRFAGDLVAPDEISGNVYAIAPDGASALVATSGVAHGQDTGMESEVFMPTKALAPVLVADRLTPGNHHPGDDVILRIGVGALARAGARPGDLLVTGEGGAQTVAIRCGRVACAVTHVADGPRVAHIEGHIVL